MKQIGCLIAFIFFCTTSFAQKNLYPDTGRVGLGYPSPRAKLEVADWIASLNISSNKNTEAMADNDVIGSINFYKHYALANAASIRLLQAGNSFYYSQAHLAFCTTSVGSPYTCVPEERMRITSGGNVGIGTTNPGEKLSVNGNIRAKEIKVENDHWPDYVFTKNYELLSLAETEKHIKKNGHLPGIPSAEDVKANGIDLGDMNAILLKKIEELTLHLITQHKINEEQQIINEKLLKRLEALSYHNKLKK